MKHKTFWKYALWLPPALWYKTVWSLSAQPASVSGDLSDRLLYRFLLALSPAFAASGEAARAEAVELLSFLERKAAHMFLYFVLALLLLAALSLWAARRRALLGALLLCAAAAALDEYHQTFVPGRSGEVRDLRRSRAALALLGGLCCLPAALALLPLPIAGFSLLRQAAAPFVSLLLLPGGALLRAARSP